MRRRAVVVGVLMVLVSPASAQSLNPKGGSEIGTVVEAFLSPHQEPGEEKDTPSLATSEFRSTGPSR